MNSQKLILILFISLVISCSAPTGPQSSYVTDGSELSPCPDAPTSNWSNCFGTYTYTNGDKYVGEYKDGNLHGQGVYTYADGKVVEGIWGNGEFIDAKKANPNESD